MHGMARMRIDHNNELCLSPCFIANRTQYNDKIPTTASEMYVPRLIRFRRPFCVHKLYSVTMVGLTGRIKANGGP